MKAKKNEKTVKDDKNEAVKKTWNRIKEFINPTLIDYAEYDYETLKQEKNGVETYYKATEDTGNINSAGKVVQSKRVRILPQFLQKREDIKKSLMVAYEQAYKANEYEANSRHNKRKSYYIFMGFSVSFSLLLQRVNVYNPSVENALIVYLVIVCICATWYVWVLLKKPNIVAIKRKESKQEISDSENKDNFDISRNEIEGFPSLKHEDKGTPFIPSPFFLAKGILALNHNDYLMTCMEVLGRRNLNIRQEIAYESKVFENYFITFVSSSLLLLCWIIIWAVFIPIVQYLYYLVVEYLYPLFIQ